jgi:hypothetical protein
MEIDVAGDPCLTVLPFDKGQIADITPRTRENHHDRRTTTGRACPRFHTWSYWVSHGTVGAGAVYRCRSMDVLGQRNILKWRADIGRGEVFGEDLDPSVISTGKRQVPKGLAFTDFQWVTSTWT